MKRTIRIIITFITGLLFIGVGMYTISMLLNPWAENGSNYEEEATTEVIYVAEVDENQEEVIEEKFRIDYVSLHPAGVGHVAWYIDTSEDVGLTNFTISADDEVEFDNHITNMFPDKEEYIKEMESAIIAKSEEDKRAIYFLEGTINKELNEGVMNWHNQRQFSGEVRFTVEDDGKIIANESDWNALPETDEKTIEDFYYTAEQMIHNKNN